MAINSRHADEPQLSTSISAITRVWLVRHGETDRAFAGRFNGRDDVPLNNNGRRQCQHLAAQLINQPIDAVISSPLQRALETAQLVVDGRGLPVRQDGRLVEIDYGRWENQTYQEVRQHWPDEMAAWEANPALCKPPQGETGIAVVERSLEALMDVVRQWCGQHILVVAHKTVNRLLLCHLLGLPLKQYRRDIPQPPCAINLLTFGPATEVSVVLPDELFTRQGLLSPLSKGPRY